MKERFVVVPVVCDYGVRDTMTNEIDCICDARANALLIAEILNVDRSKPNCCTIWQPKLSKELQKRAKMKQKMQEIVKKQTKNNENVDENCKNTQKN